MERMGWLRGKRIENVENKTQANHKSKHRTEYNTKSMMSGDLKYLSAAVVAILLSPYTRYNVRSFICPSALHFVHSGIVL